MNLNEVKDRKGKGSGTKDACYYELSPDIQSGDVWHQVH